MVAQTTEKKALTIYLAGTGYQAEDDRYAFKYLAEGTDTPIITFDGPGAKKSQSESCTGGTVLYGNTQSELAKMFEKISKKVNEAKNSSTPFTDINFVGFSRGGVNAVALTNMMQDPDLFTQEVNLFLVDPSAGHGRKGKSEFISVPECVKHAVVIYPQDASRMYGRTDEMHLAYHKKTKVRTLIMPGDHSDCLRIKAKTGEVIASHSCRAIALAGHALIHDFLTSHGAKLNTVANMMPVVEKVTTRVGRKKFSCTAAIQNHVRNDRSKLIEVYEAGLKQGQKYINDHHQYLAEQGNDANTKGFFVATETIEDQINHNLKSFVIDVCNQYLAVSSSVVSQRSVVKALLHALESVEETEAVKKLVEEHMKKMKSSSRLYNAFDLLLHGNRPAFHQIKRRSDFMAGLRKLYYNATWLLRPGNEELPQQIPRSSNSNIIGKLDRGVSQHEKIKHLRETEIITQSNLISKNIEKGVIVSPEVCFDKLNELSYKAACIKSYKAYDAVRKTHTQLVKHVGGVAVQLNKKQTELIFKSRSRSRWPVFSSLMKKRFSLRKDGLGLYAFGKKGKFKGEDKHFALAQFAVSMIFEAEHLKAGYKKFSIAGNQAFELVGINQELIDWLKPIMDHVLNIHHRITGVEKTIALEVKPGTEIEFTAGDQVQQKLNPDQAKVVNDILLLWVERDALLRLKGDAVNSEAEQPAPSVPSLGVRSQS